jgi:hypothetical protein
LPLALLPGAGAMLRAAAASLDRPICGASADACCWEPAALLRLLLCKSPSSSPGTGSLAGPGAGAISLPLLPLLSLLLLPLLLLLLLLPGLYELGG